MQNTKKQMLWLIRKNSRNLFFCKSLVHVLSPPHLVDDLKLKVIVPLLLLEVSEYSLIVTEFPLNVIHDVSETVVEVKVQQSVFSMVKDNV